MRLSAIAATFVFSTIERKGQTMGFRNLAQAVSRFTLSAKQRAKLRKAFQERRTELRRALAAVERGLAQLSKPAKKRAKRRAKKR
jgi:Skp family chaperone for outer membrane proteins